MGHLINHLLEKISPVDKLSTYDTEYFVYNYLRHVNTWYGFLVKLYYRYVAYYCMIKPTNICKNSKVLDIGCSVGILVQQFNKLGYQAIGIDINKAAIENSLCPQSCFLVNTTSQLEYQDNYFDLVVSREVLEHIPLSDIDKCIREWDRVGKRVMVHIIGVAERGPRVIDNPLHVNIKPEKWWIDKFKEHGYRAIKNPTRMFFSLFGNSGYFMMIKEL